MNTKSLNIFIYTFAIIGLVSILSSFNNLQETNNDFVMVASGTDAVDRPTMYVLNTRTGVVRYFEAEEEQIVTKKKKRK
tara:strand:- start:5560 stop:5796 length:237 start_codon:yes stop_codon:yes gene_type:complete